MRVISDHELLKICYLYYNEDRTQQEISNIFGLSRFKIGRLLKQARESHLVTIRLNPPPGDLTEIEIELARKYNLKESIVVNSSGLTDKSILTRLGEAGAHYINGIIHQCKILGIAWGRSVSHVIHSISPVNAKNLTVVQITGGMGSIEGTDANALTITLGQKLKAKVHIIQAPVIVKDRALRDNLLKESQIHEAIATAKKSDAVIFGIGLPNEDGLLSKAGLITPETAATLENSGAIGAICGRFFDANGKKCLIGIDERIVGLSLKDLLKVPNKICIAAGPQKVAAIAGAMNGGFLDVFVTDQLTAVDLLRRS